MNKFAAVAQKSIQRKNILSCSYFHRSKCHCFWIRYLHMYIENISIMCRITIKLTPNFFLTLLPQKWAKLPSQYTLQCFLATATVFPSFTWGNYPSWYSEKFFVVSVVACKGLSRCLIPELGPRHTVCIGIDQMSQVSS